MAVSVSIIVFLLTVIYFLLVFWCYKSETKEDYYSHILKDHQNKIKAIRRSNKHEIR